MLINCVVVDDEPPARLLLENHLSKLPDLLLVATCASALEAADVLRNQTIDLLFLDINMPALSGLDFVRGLSDPPAIIFTTAYREHAVTAYELDVVDYLVKPISFQRFFQSVERFRQRRADTANPPIALPHVADHFFVWINKKAYRVNFTELRYLESRKDYVHLFLNEQELIVKQTLTSLLEQLPADRFLRIHRSFVVAVSAVTAFTRQDVELDGLELPIGASYREAVTAALG